MNNERMQSRKTVYSKLDRSSFLLGIAFYRASVWSLLSEVRECVEAAVTPPVCGLQRLFETGSMREDGED